MASRWVRFTAGALSLLVFAGLLTLWVPGRWPVLLFEAAVLLLAAASAVRGAWGGRGRRSSLPLAAPAGVVGWGLLQLLMGWSEYRFATGLALLSWTTYLAALGLAEQAYGYSELRRRFRSALIWFGFLLAVVSTLQYFLAPGRIFWIYPVGYRAVGPFLNRDHYSTFVELVLPLILVEAVRDSRKSWSHGAMGAALVASVIAGASRAGSILVTLEVLAVAFWGLSPRLRSAGAWRKGLAWTALCGVAFAAVVGWKVLWRRFQEPDPFSGRREMLESSLAMLRDRPWTGFGLGTWPVVYPAYAGRDFGPGVYVNHAHNDWAEWAAEGGLPMLVLLATLALWSLRQAVRQPWGLGVAAAFCHSAVDFPMQRPALAALLFLLMGAMAGAQGRPRGRHG